MKTCSTLLSCTALLALLSTAPTFASLRPPEAIRQSAPGYPFELRKAGREAAVLVHFHVTPAGSTKEVTVVSSTDPAFEPAALEAVRQWTFLPARQDGVAVDCPTIQLVLFHLPENNPAILRARLADALQPRIGKPGGVRHLVHSDDNCICGSRRRYDDCHRRAF
jgi:TonB family protein